MGSRKIGLFFLTVIFFLIFSESPQNFHSFYGIQEAHAQSFKVGSFTKQTGAGQTVTHNLGVTPKALILWTNGKTNETGSTDFMFSFGVTDQSRASYSTATASQNVVPSNNSIRMAAKAITIVQWGEVTVAECDVTAWDATTFTLMWTTNNATAYVIHYIIIGGTDVRSKVVRWTMATAVGNKTVTGVGFKPDVVIHTHLGADFVDTPPANRVNANPGLGVMDAGGNQWANVLFSLYNVNPTDTQRAQLTDACLIDIDASPSVVVKGSFRSMDADGFTVNFSTVDLGAQVVSLALAGINVKAGNFGKTVPAPTYVQSTSTNLLSNVVTLTLPNVSTSGNLIVLSFNHDNQGISVSSVTDSAGNSYQLAAGPTNWGTVERAYTYYASNIKGGSQITITITLTGTPSLYGEFYVAEYSGVATSNPLDQTSVGTGTGTTFDSGSKTTTQASELIYGFVDSGASATVDPSFTARETLNQNALADRTVSSTGSYHFFGTLGSSTTWVAHMATFKGSGATQVVRGVGFQPSAVLLSSFQSVTRATPRTHSRFGLGAADGTTQGSSALTDTNALNAIPVAWGIDKTSKVFMKVDNNTSTINAEANLTSMDADGFTLNWTTNDAVATEIVYLALGIPGTASFQYKRQITINALNATTCSSQTLSSFPVLISLSGSWLRTQANDPTNGRIQNANGYDIIFRDGSNNQLDHEIEKYDGGASAGTLVAWVRVPTIPQAGTTIYMYYGNSAITSPTTNPTGVWDSNYLAVYHLSQAPPSTILDSTSARRDLTPFESAQAAGQIGWGIGFDGGNDRLRSSTPLTTTSFTLEAWVSNTGGWADWEAIVDLVDTPGDTFRDFSVYPTYPGSLCVDNYTPYRISDPQSGTAWRHVVARFSSSGNSLRGFINGLQTSYTNAPGFPAITTTSVVVGAWENPTDGTFADHWTGTIDEVRISNIARTNCWIQTGYDNQKASSTLVTILAEGSASPTAVTLSGFTATEYEDGVLVEWKTGYEVNNLGFHVYREENRQLVRLTPEPVAGSAFLAGSRTALTAGHHYHWWDNSAIADVQGPLTLKDRPLASRTVPQVAGLENRKSFASSEALLERSAPQAERSAIHYWLKDIDLNGTHKMHGPVTPILSREPLPEKFRPELLSEVGLRLQEKYHHYWKVQELKERLALKRLEVRGAPRGRGLRTGNKVPLRSGPTGLEGRGFHRKPDPAANEVQRVLAGRAAVKLLVREEGWYRVTQSELVASGLSSRVNPKYLQLFVEGQEQPIRIIGKRDGVFGPRDAIEFYGVGLDTPSTDKRVYWLSEGLRPGKRVEEHRSQGGQISSASFLYTIERKDRVIYFPNLRNGDEENWFGPIVSSVPVDQLLNVQHLDPAPSEDALLEVSIQGGTEGTHRVKVYLNDNDNEVGELVFEGQAKGLLQVEVPQAILQEGENLVSLVAQNGEMDISVIDTIKLSYWHTYTADNDGLRFTAQGGNHLTVNGFSHPRIRVFDITDSKDVIEVIGKVRSEGKGYAITFRVPETGSRTLLALTEEGVKSTEGVISNRPSSWHEGRNGADLVIIAYGDFVGSLQPLKTLRESQGLKVALIDIEDLYDEFSFGARSPKAIKDFLSLAKAKWHKPPRFVLLVGDASFDPKNYYGYGDYDFVPTKLIDTVYMETASDDWFVDFNNDGLPEMAIGRLPVRTVEEANTVVSKIIGYEKTGAIREALLVADMNEKDDEFSFEGASEEIRSLLPSFLMVRKIYRGQFSSDSDARRVLLGSINEGPLLVNFIGHGSLEIWRGSILTSDDAENFTNRGLPFFVSMTCLNGSFQDPYAEPLGEALLKAPQGGAIAVWTSSGLTEPDKQAVMNKELIRLLFNGQSLTLGEATAKAKKVISDQDIRKTWILFGDPTTRLK